METKSQYLLRLMEENPYGPHMHQSIGMAFHAKNQLFSKHRNDRRNIRQETKTLRLQQKHDLKQQKIRAKYAKKMDKWHRKQDREHMGFFARLKPLAHQAVNNQAAYALRHSIHQKLLR